MASIKNKNSSTRLHASRTRIRSSRLASHKKIDRKLFSNARRAIITVIIFSMLIVILTILITTFQKPENIVKQKISDIATSYYENYYYPNIISASTADRTLEEIISPYAKTGFAPISLRQLLLFDDERYGEITSTLTLYCDENKTFVRIHPEAPFGKKDYRMDITYSCTF